MTPVQFENFGIPLDKWILQPAFKSVLFSNEGHLYGSNPKTIQFYFDSKNKLIFCRNLTGIEKETKTNEDDVKMPNGKYISISVGGIKDKIVGRYHYVYDLNAISMVY